MRTCPECKNRYAKHTCIKALSHGAVFLATCNVILLLIGRCKIGKYTLPSSEMNITGTLPQAGNLKLFVPSLPTRIQHGQNKTVLMLF